MQNRCRKKFLKEKKRLTNVLYGLTNLAKSFIIETKFLISYALLVFTFEFGKLNQKDIFLQLYEVGSWIILVASLTLQYLFKKPHIELRSIISFALAGSFPSFAAFVSMVLFVVFTSWLAEDLRNITNPTCLINATLDVIYALGLLPAFALSIPEYKPKSGSSTKPEPKKVLISALSNPNFAKEELDKLKDVFSDAFLKENIEEAQKLLKDLKLKNKHDCPEEIAPNWIPLLRSYLFHRKRDKIERLYVLVSKESSKYKDKFEEIIGSNEIIQFSKEIDFNDYDAIHIELLSTLKDIRRKGYTDKDISVFISGGTSAVTLALTMFAVKEGRQVEYVKQDKSKDIVKIDIGLRDLYSFAPELKG